MQKISAPLFHTHSHKVIGVKIRQHSGQLFEKLYSVHNWKSLLILQSH